MPGIYHHTTQTKWTLREWTTHTDDTIRTLDADETPVKMLPAAKTPTTLRDAICVEVVPLVLEGSSRGRVE